MQDQEFYIKLIEIVKSNDALQRVLRTQLNKKLGNFPFWLDIKNQARVHLWYKEKFGIDIEAYSSLKSAIDTWPTTATALGIRRSSKNVWHIYAPFGIQDVFDLMIK